MTTFAYKWVNCRDVGKSVTRLKCHKFTFKSCHRVTLWRTTVVVIKFTLIFFIES